MEHFRVLPTEKAIREIDDAGLRILYHNWLRAMPEEAMKSTYWQRRIEESRMEDPMVREQLMSLGYDDAAVEAIVQEMHDAGA